MINRAIGVHRAESTSRRRLLATACTGLGALFAGCSTETTTPTPQPEEATITIRLQNRDDQPREFDVVVNQGATLTDSFSGTLPANQDDPIRMVATVRVTTEQYDFTISAPNGQRGRTWDPTECGEFVVDASIENGEPGFETECLSS